MSKRFRNCSFPKGDNLHQRKQRVPQGTVLTTGELQEFWGAQGWDGTTHNSKPGFHMQIMDCAQGLLLEQEGAAGISSSQT